MRKVVAWACQSPWQPFSWFQISCAFWGFCVAREATINEASKSRITCIAKDENAQNKRDAVFVQCIPFFSRSTAGSVSVQAYRYQMNTNDNSHIQFKKIDLKGNSNTSTCLNESTLIVMIHESLQEQTFPIK